MGLLCATEQTPQHTYQILTTRAERMFDYFSNNPVPSNVWLGVTVENKRQGLPRIDKLRHLKAKVLFLSVEPLLEDLGEINLKNIDWVIVGGESGNRARPMEKEWVVNIKQQCETEGIAFFFKQLNYLLGLGFLNELFFRLCAAIGSPSFF
jgi:protein gp37